MELGVECMGGRKELGVLIPGTGTGTGVSERQERRGSLIAFSFVVYVLINPYKSLKKKIHQSLASSLHGVLLVALWCRLLGTSRADNLDTSAQK